MKRLFIRCSAFLLLATLAACQSTGNGTVRPTQHVAPNPKAAAINAAAGAEYIKLGEYKFALEKLEKALAQDPNLAEAHNIIAVLYQRLAKMDKSEYHFKQAIARAPEYSEAHNNYGVLLCGQGRYSEAEQHFLSAISDPLYPNPANAYENAGLCVDKIPDATLAEKYFRTALQLNPYLRKSLFKMADLSYQNIDYVAAKSYIERYRAVSRWTSRALLLAIKIEHKVGGQDKVASYILLLKGQFPDSDEAREVRQGQY
ncbi:MAG: type IV pilus biogenesis/stability protein PilW [Methylophaga sp.]|nr:type IV pilus biogenesis/stability protein PilW [Methylophaga sp.]